MRNSDITPNRQSTIHHSINGSYAIRQGDWKLCLCPGSGGWSGPRPHEARNQPDLPPVQLYNLATDIAETNNVQANHPDIVRELTAELQRCIDKGRSTAGIAQKNDRDVRIN